MDQYLCHSDSCPPRPVALVPAIPPWKGQKTHIYHHNGLLSSPLIIAY